jgi:predicted metalloprotease with PDZ domain
MKPFFERYIRGTDDVPLARLLAPFGVKYSDVRKAQKASLDVNLGRDGNDAKLAQVHQGGAAHLAGLSAGDVLVAADGLRVSAIQPIWTPCWAAMRSAPRWRFTPSAATS